MGPQYVELERDLTLLLWLDISMNYNLSQKVYTADCMSILSEGTVWLRFLTVTKALIGDHSKCLLLAELQLVKFHGLLHFVDQIKKFGSSLNYFSGFLESFLKDKLKKPNQARESMATCTECNMTFSF